MLHRFSIAQLFEIDKCKQHKIFSTNDNLDERVAALPPSFTKRFGEIVWAQGGVGFGFWPACIYDPRLTVGGARKLALKNIGKKHLVYFFGCAEAPFTVLPDSKCIEWETGLLEEYDTGKSARAFGKNRTTMFEWALQVAILENEKPIEFRLDWNHEEDAAVIAAGKSSSSNQNTGTGKRRNSTSSSGEGNKKKPKPIDTKTIEKIQGHELLTSPITATNQDKNRENTANTASNTSAQATRKSNRERKPSKSFDNSTPDSNSDAKSKNGTVKLTSTRSTFCTILVVKGSATDPNLDADTAFASSKNVGFITLPSDTLAKFEDARVAIERDLDEDSFPNRWKFYVPGLGPLSRKQEGRYEIIHAMNADKVGDGSRAKPVKLFLVKWE